MADLVGQTLGKYRVESVIGSGGMGEVYRGVHIHLNRPAAIKVMHQRVASDPTFQARFRREAQSAAALSHRNIAQVYDFGEERGLYYLVMELVPDGSYRTLLQRRASGIPTPDTLLLDMIRQAAEGIGAAQAQGMVHRDIKPDNLLLLRDTTADSTAGETYTLKISDFGLARLAEGNSLTVTGTILGTPSYMSPEQCQGKSLDGRSDLYSLGVVLYQTLAGVQPFTGSNPAEVMFKHVNTPPTPPRAVKPEVSGDLNDIAMRCLAKRPEDRYQTGNELAGDLAQVIAGKPLRTTATRPTASPANTGQRAPTAPTGSPATPGAGMRTTGGGVAIPPVLPPMQAGSGPHLRVVDDQGKIVREVPLTLGAISIGRQPDNSLVLTGEAISRHHVRINWDGTSATLLDLGSANGTILGGERLLPRVEQAWKPGTPARIGRFWLMLEIPPAIPGATSNRLDTMRAVGVSARPNFNDDVPPPLPPSLAATPPFPQTPNLGMGAAVPVGAGPSATPAPSGPSRIALAFDQPTLTLTPGQVASCKITVTNSGTLVDHITLRIEGVPSDWVQGSDHAIQLNPGAKGTLALTINVARDPRNRAGQYRAVVRGLSRENPGDLSMTEGTWTVLPFPGGSMALRPARARGRAQAQYTVALQNEGNAPEYMQFSGEDDEQRLSYQFSQPAVKMEPGTTGNVALTVHDKMEFVGNERPPYPFTVRGRPPTTGTPTSPSTGGGGAQGYSAGGQFVNVPLLPAWVPSRAAMVGGLLALLVVYLVALRPSLPPPLGVHSAATATATVVATAGPGGPAACAEVSSLSGAQPAAPVNGFGFQFPSSTVGLVRGRNEAKSYLFETMALCTENIKPDGVQNGLNSNLIQSGWQSSSNFPSGGNASSPCGSAVCWSKNTPSPGLFVRLSGAAASGKVTTYTIDLAIAPFTSSASINDPGTAIKGNFRLDPNETTDDLQLADNGGGTLVLSALTNAGISSVSDTSLDQVSLSDLTGQNYQTTDPTPFANGTVFAVKTNSGHFAKVQVTSDTSPYQISWVLYQANF